MDLHIMLVDYLQKKTRKRKFKETGDSWCIYQNELDQTRFQHDIAYGDLKDLSRRRASYKTFGNKAFNIAKYDGYQCGLNYNGL